MRVQVLDEGCTPFKKHKTDAGWDLIASDGCVIAKTNTRKIGTGIRVAIPEGYMGMIVPRSGLGIKGVNLANTVGVIDSSYRGEVFVCIKNNTPLSLTIEKGTRFAQLIVVPVNIEDIEVVDSLEDTERGEGGFGSTGTKAKTLPLSKTAVVKPKAAPKLKKT